MTYTVSSGALNSTPSMEIYKCECSYFQSFFCHFQAMSKRNRRQQKSGIVFASCMYVAKISEQCFGTVGWAARRVASKCSLQSSLKILWDLAQFEVIPKIKAIETKTAHVHIVYACKNPYISNIYKWEHFKVSVTLQLTFGVKSCSSLRSSHIQLSCVSYMAFFVVPRQHLFCLFSIT